MTEVILIRHGETEWSRVGRHTSTTDLDLTRLGQRQAVALQPRLAGRSFAAVLSSPRRRALRTAELAGLTVTTVEQRLAEWDYGDYEGITTDEIQRNRPGWDLWRDGCPAGEALREVGDRLDEVLAEVRLLLDRGDVAVVGHGHALRILGARWVGLPPSAGALLRLDNGTLSRLGHEHGRPVLLSWNAPA